MEGRYAGAAPHYIRLGPASTLVAWTGIIYDHRPALSSRPLLASALPLGTATSRPRSLTQPWTADPGWRR